MNLSENLDELEDLVKDSSQPGVGEKHTIAENDESKAGRAENAPSGLFVNDHGELPLDTRRALVQLLSGPCIDASRHSKLWTVLVRDEKMIRIRLSEVFLELVIDREHQIAFTRQAETDGLEVPTLLRRVQLTFLDTVLLLFLRQRLAEAEANSERAGMDKAEMCDHLALYERSGNTDHAGFGKKVQASIEKFKKNSILQPIQATPDRFEVSPTLKLLFPPEQIQAITRQYKSILGQESGTDEISEPIGEDEE